MERGSQYIHRSETNLVVECWYVLGHEKRNKYQKGAASCVSIHSTSQIERNRQPKMIGSSSSSVDSSSMPKVLRKSGPNRL